MGKNDTFGSLVYSFAIAADLAAASNDALSSARRAIRPRATTLLPLTRVVSVKSGLDTLRALAINTPHEGSSRACLPDLLLAYFLSSTSRSNPDFSAGLAYAPSLCRGNVVFFY